MLDINQLQDLSRFLEAFEEACVDNGITPTGSVAVDIPDGRGHVTSVFVVPLGDLTDDTWHLAVRERG